MQFASQSVGSVSCGKLFHIIGICSVKNHLLLVLNLWSASLPPFDAPSLLSSLGEQSSYSYLLGLMLSVISPFTSLTKTLRAPSYIIMPCIEATPFLCDHPPCPFLNLTRLLAFCDTALSSRAFFFYS